MSEKICSFEGCGRKHRTRGLCSSHYRQQLAGKELKPLKQDVPVEDRFMQFVEKSPDGSWLWKGYTMSSGYGRFSFVVGKAVLAHRFAYELFVGPIGEGTVVHHTCAVRNCVNPDHLQAVSHASNNAEMMGRKAYEKRIAELEAENLRLSSLVRKLQASAQ